MSEIDDTVRRIEEMDTQSASVVAVEAAEALRELADRECYSVDEFVRLVERNSSALQRANSSHAPLHTTQQRIVESLTETEADTVDEAKERLLAAIDDVVEEVESSKRLAAERAAELLSDGDVLLTHENSSTVMATLERALEAGKTFELYVTESRPRFLGRRTARQLAEWPGVDVTLITDSAAGYYLSECDRVLVGMNCLIDDVVYNRIGTYPIATAAADQDVPMTVIASSAKFIGSGFDFQNKFRPGSEVLLEPMEGFAVENPAYDATPIRLVETIVTEEAVMQF
ncbi:translation initiation factor eIF-2B subunit delta [Halogranum gelatinilyticum]|uniref:Translation initiation factor eIF-2B subunit delta n=1 Tax=Halogranum gelatinilyticum TaxID=660521 RepID=A0A1G9YRZ7_9EURY|nr:translation initiation factor eIF-2B [Halogranum gelatinilyticum]SDN11882.1 translation initiation factor eIF-2B subunit delta [Halogranum gelatinilyticum]